MIEDKLYCSIIGRKGIKIFFNQEFPEDVLEDKKLENLSGKELKAALDKPFYVLEDLKVCIEYGRAEQRVKGVSRTRLMRGEVEKYSFTIPKGYDWNGANVPPFCWLIIGQQKEPRFKLASCVHDYMCEHHEVVGNNRYLSTLVFETLCEYFGRFNKVKRWAMFHSVDNWQKICGKDLNKNRWGK